ncbi:Ldh family oxidoreductase, partial [Dehalococcoidia bacterium]|nr:Ldh family oxidoreductase [Dehalococcoidia bacterium]
MPKISADRLRHIASKLLQGAGASLEEATIIAKHSIASNLGGHDSHGIIQIPKYIEQVKANDIIPGAPFDIVQESATTTVVDGNWGFGYVVSERAMALTIEKARKQNVAATTVYRQSHVGRLTDYPVMAAEAGMI